MEREGRSRFPSTQASQQSLLPTPPCESASVPGAPSGGGGAPLGPTCASRSVRGARAVSSRRLADSKSAAPPSAADRPNLPLGASARPQRCWRAGCDSTMGPCKGNAPTPRGPREPNPAGQARRHSSLYLPPGGAGGRRGAAASFAQRFGARVLVARADPNAAAPPLRRAGMSACHGRGRIGRAERAGGGAVARAFSRAPKRATLSRRQTVDPCFCSMSAEEESGCQRPGLAAVFCKRVANSPTPLPSVPPQKRPCAPSLWWCWGWPWARRPS